MTSDGKKQLIAEALASAIVHLDDDAIDAMLDAVEAAADRTGGWIKYAVNVTTKILRYLIGVPDDDIDGEIK